MTYTFWHSGILIGESDFDESSGYPRQRAGVFLPTAYGVEVLPRLSGILSAGHALKAHLDANGLSPDDMNARQVEDVLDTTAGGQKILEIGRMLSEVQIRAPDGRPLEFASIAFSDVKEIQRLARELELGELDDLPPDAPRYIVSATLRHDADGLVRTGKASRFGKPYRPNEN
jgi:hypothetical protein